MRRSNRNWVTLAITLALGLTVLSVDAGEFSSVADQDTWIGFNGTTDYSGRNGDAKLEVQGDFGNNSRQQRAILKWDFSGIGTDAVVGKVLLRIRDAWVYSASGQPQASVEVRAIVSNDAWVESTVGWVNYDASNPWAQSGVGGPTGGDMDGTGDTLGTTVYATIDIPTDVGGNTVLTPVDLDITPLVQGWIDGSIPNNGLALNMGAGFGAANYWMTIPNQEVSGDDAPLLEFYYIESPFGGVFNGLPDHDTWVGFSGSTDYGNRDADARLEVQGDFGDNSRQQRCILKWDLSSISNRATIAEATLRVRGGWSLSPASPQGNVEVRRIVGNDPWTETTATWVNYDGANPWDQSGVGGPTDLSMNGTGDTLGTTVYGTIAIPTDTSNTPIAPVDVDVADLVQSWVSGEFPNAGLAMSVADGFSGSSYWLHLVSSESDPEASPYLVVLYEVIPPRGTVVVLR